MKTVVLIGVWKIDVSLFSDLSNMLIKFHENRFSRLGRVQFRNVDLCCFNLLLRTYLKCPSLIPVALAFGVKESTKFNNFCTGVNLCVVLFVIISGSFKGNLIFMLEINIPNMEKILHA